MAAQQAFVEGLAAAPTSTKQIYIPLDLIWIESLRSQLASRYVNANLHSLPTIALPGCSALLLVPTDISAGTLLRLRTRNTAASRRHVCSLRSAVPVSAALRSIDWAKSQTEKVGHNCSVVGVDTAGHGIRGWKVYLGNALQLHPATYVRWVRPGFTCSQFRR